jgi:hypothetical protein
MRMKIKRIAAILPVIFLFGCAGVFQNPDVVHGVEQSAFNWKIALPPVMELERQVLDEFRDTGVVRLPEHDFYNLQNNVLNCMMLFSRPDFSPAAFTDNIGRKDITRNPDLDNPSIDVQAYLKQLPAGDVTVYRIDSCTTELLRAFIRNNVPVLIYGTVTIKKMLKRDNDRVREDKDIKPSLTRRFETFDLVSAYQKGMGPSRILPGEEGDQFIFNTRNTLDFKAYAGRELKGQLLNLFGGSEFANSGWVIRDFYVVLPLEREMRDVYAKVMETAVQWGMDSKAPEPRRIY